MTIWGRRQVSRGAGGPPRADQRGLPNDLLDADGRGGAGWLRQAVTFTGSAAATSAAMAAACWLVRATNCAPKSVRATISAGIPGRRRRRSGRSSRPAGVHLGLERGPGPIHTPSSSMVHRMWRGRSDVSIVASRNSLRGAAVMTRPRRAGRAGRAFGWPRSWSRPVGGHSGQGWQVGSGGKNRTCDTGLMSPLLYH